MNYAVSRKLCVAFLLTAGAFSAATMTGENQEHTQKQELEASEKEEVKDPTEPKVKSRDYELTVVVMVGSESPEAPLGSTSIDVFYGDKSQTKPTKIGNCTSLPAENRPAHGSCVSFHFSTEAENVTIRAVAPGMDPHNKEIDLVEEKIIHTIVLKKSN